MPIIRRDASELRYNAIHLLPKQGNPDYYTQLLRNAKNFFYGMNREDLVQTIDLMVEEKVEKPLNTSIQLALLTYKNLPTMNSFTIVREGLYKGMKVYKWTIQKWLDEIEQWIFEHVIDLEGEIRWTTPARQYI